MTHAWHFTTDTLRDGRLIPPAGETLRYEGPLAICESGLHASIRMIDALKYAPGPVLHRVDVGDSWESQDHEDKLVSRERTILWSIDATDTLRAFARKCALDVIHLWDAPAVVRQYLETGDESLREDARDAAQATAWDAARDAALAAVQANARDAAWDAARAAAWDAARAAAWGAAWDAAQAMAWDAAQATAWGAALTTARAAAWGAVWDTTQVIAWDAARAAVQANARRAAWDAAVQKQNERLTKMVLEAAGKAE